MWNCPQKPARTSGMAHRENNPFLPEGTDTLSNLRPVKSNEERRCLAAWVSLQLEGIHRYRDAYCGFPLTDHLFQPGAIPTFQTLLPLHLPWESFLFLQNGWSRRGWSCWKLWESRDQLMSHGKASSKYIVRRNFPLITLSPVSWCQPWPRELAERAGRPPCYVQAP